MSALDKSPGTSATIYKVSAETAIAHTECRIGGAGAVVTVPASCDTLLGIYAHLSTPLPTDNEMVIAWGYLDSEDGFNIKPFEFLRPRRGWAGQPSVWATTARPASSTRSIARLCRVGG